MLLSFQAQSNLRYSIDGPFTFGAKPYSMTWSTPDTLERGIGATPMLNRSPEAANIESSHSWLWLRNELYELAWLSSTIAALSIAGVGFAVVLVIAFERYGL